MALQAPCNHKHLTVTVAPADSATMMLSSKSLQSKAICSRAFSKHSVCRPTRLNAALLETISFDSVGKLTWDAQQVGTLPGKAEILEGYELRPNQVPFLDYVDVYVWFMICIDCRGDMPDASVSPAVARAVRRGHWAGGRRNLVAICLTSSHICMLTAALGLHTQLLHGKVFPRTAAALEP